MKKKIFALVLSAVLAFCPISAFAEENTMSEEVKDAVVAVRSAVEIDDEYSEFSYETEEENGIKLFILRWENEDGGSVEVCVKSDGEILWYYNYASDYYSSGLSKVTRQQAQETAEAFIKKAAPERAAVVKLRDYSRQESRIRLVYTQDINSIPVACDDIQLEISAQSGKVCSFSSSSLIWRDAVNTNTEGIIDEDEAKKAFLDNGGVELVYNCNFDYKEKKAELYPVYKISQLRIDARRATELSYVYYDNVKRESEMATASYAASGAAEDAAYELNESELAEVEKTKDYITRDEAVKALVKKNITDSSASVTSARLVLSSYSNDCLWSLSGEDFSASVNASSGNVESFFSYNEYAYDSENENKKKLTESQAKDKINGYLKLLGSEYLNEISYGDIEYNEYSNSYSTRYSRKVNGIKTDSNYIEISINAETGRLIRYNKIWYGDITVSGKTVKLSEEQVFDIYKNNSGYGLYYDIVGEIDDLHCNLDLVYESAQGDLGYYSAYYIDPESGKRVDYRGQVIEEGGSNGYTDIEGCEYENEINALYDSGYRLDTDEFRPDDPMSAESFMKLFNKNNTSGDKYLEELGISKSDILTKMSCAKIIAAVNGLDEIAENSEIFADLYSDVSAENRGYADIAASLGIIEAESGDSFAPDETVTNAMGAHYIYNNESRRD